MLLNFLRSTLRNWYRERIYTGINLIGLSLGFAVCILLALYLHSELNFDRHFDNHERIYRVVGQRVLNGNASRIAPVSPLLMDFLEPELVQMESFVRFTPMARSLFAHENRRYYWDRVYTADPTIFEVFSHNVLAGDPDTALVEPSDIAVSESFARRYFGDDNPLGQVLQKDGQSYAVTLVFADLPPNTHLQYDVLMYRNPLAPVASGDGGVQLRGLRERLMATSDYLYLRMAEGFDPAVFEQLSQRLWREQLEPLIGLLDIEMSFSLEPLAGIHLNSLTEQDLPRGNRFYLTAFIATGVFLLLIACINYINLATARATQRALEVGVRKIAGANRGQLMLGFLLESLAFSALALVGGLLLAELFVNAASVVNLPVETLSLGQLKQPGLLAVLVLLVAVVGMLAGAYPAFYLVGFATLSTLRRGRKSGKLESRVRHSLVFAQFSITIAVIAVALLMYLQVQYLGEKPLGFDNNNKLVTVVYGADAIERLPAFLEEIKRHPNVLNASISGAVPGEPLEVALMELETNDGSLRRQRFSRVFADANFIDTLGIALVAGRQYVATEAFATEQRYTMVNETMVRQLGWDEPLGKRVGGREVIGVVADYHFHDLHQAVEPLELRLDLPVFEGLPAERRPRVNRSLIISLGNGDREATLDFIDGIWNRFGFSAAPGAPAQPFEYRFLSDRLDQLYTSDRQQTRIFGIFSGLLVFVSCLGLFGLAAYNTAQRSKELGIRKIFGATVAHILFLLFRSVLFIVAASSTIAWLVSYAVMNLWLQNFAYRVDIDYRVFLAATGFCLALAFVTVALQSWRTARANPVNVLRYD